MVRIGSASTLTDHFGSLIRSSIISGELAPGSRLSPSALAREYETSTTVIRQALVRLTSARMVQFVPNQGFFVLSLDLHDLEDLTLVRINSDAFGVRLAVERGDRDWEERLLEAEQSLAATPRRSHGRPSDAWSSAHRKFHLELVRGSGIQMLVENCAVLFDSTELYRRWTAPSSTVRDVQLEHRSIVAAVTKRNGEEAAELLAAHYRRSFEVMRSSGLVAEAPQHNSSGGRWRTPKRDRTSTSAESAPDSRLPAR